jgi:rRNA maturation endonuclease Nob1
MTALLTSVLLLTIKVLKVVLVAGLVIGSVAAAKKYLFGDEKINFSFTTKEKPDNVCSCCKAALEADYNFCPSCGAAKETAVEQTTAAESAV